MSFFEIGVYNPKREVNVGTIWRSANQLGAAGIFTIGARYKYQRSDTKKAHRHIPLRRYFNFDQFRFSLPMQTQLVAVEMGGKPLSKFIHPSRAIYLMGAEDHGLPQKILDECHYTVSLESINHNSYNVAVAASIIMYHRVHLFTKRWR